MIAIIIAAGQSSEMYGLDEHLPVPLFPLGDRPILHHIVDNLVRQGVRRFEFLLGHLPEKIEAYLGDGARWGASFEFHFLPADSNGLSLAETIATGLDDEIILGRADSLPELHLDSTRTPTIYANENNKWTGWVFLPQASRLFPVLAQYAAGESPILDGHFTVVSVARQLSCESVQQILQSQQHLLTGAFSESGIAARAVEPGIWIARSASVHPTATLNSPAYIGPNCKIDAGTSIGPSVVIGEGCIVGAQSSITNTLIMAGSYIGEGLELEHVIVDRNRLVNASLEASFLVSESFLLSGLQRHKTPGMQHRLVSFFAAFALFLLPLPIAGLTLLFLLLSGRGELRYRRGLLIPSTSDPNTWKEYRYLRLHLCAATMAGWWTYFVAEVWLGLISVLKRDLFLMGLKPRSREEVQSLPSDWRSLYLNSKSGLITEAFVMFGRTPSEDELYTAEAYYSATESIRHDLDLLRLYLVRLLTSSERSAVEDFSGGPGLKSSPENATER